MNTFVRVVESGSFSAAAKQLSMSPAAVSRQIATLESDIHTQLLMRSTRRMRVTPNGQRYFDLCVQILRDVEEAQSIGRGDAIDGQVKMNAPVTFGLACVVPQLHDLMIGRPGLQIHLHLEDRLVDLALDDIDVAIRVGATPPDSSELIAHPLAAFHRIVVASPKFARAQGVPKTPEGLRDFDALGFAVGPVDSWPLQDGQRTVRAQIRPVFHSNALYAVRDLALQSHGVALLPEWFAQDDIKAGRLRRLLPSWKTAPVTVYALQHRARRGAPRVRYIVDQLRGAFQKLC